MFNNKIKVYIIRGMSGRNKVDVVAEAIADKEFLEKAGFEVLCPVLKENIKPEDSILQATKSEMEINWPLDKKMIREANVVFNRSPHLPTIGGNREHGYSRYFLWKKTISIFPEGKLPKDGTVCYFEDDYVTDSLLLAIGEAYRTHGTWWKRFTWRVKMYTRSALKAYYFKLMEWFR